MKLTYTYLFIAMLLTGGGHLLAQAVPIVDEPTGPITTIEFEALEYEFGEVVEGEKVFQVFTFTNTGEEPLILSNAKGSCGCTVPKWPREPIAPGETASITVEFNSKNKRGRRNQRVTITANTNPPQTFLYLKGTVLKAEDDMPERPEESTAPVKPDPNCFAIFPNPTADILKLDLESYAGQEVSVSILSQSGAVMAKRQFRVEDNPVEFQVSHYPAGTYIANVQVPGQQMDARCFVVTR